MQAQAHHHARRAGGRKPAESNRGQIRSSQRCKQNAPKLAIAAAPALIGLPSIPKNIPSKLVSKTTSTTISLLALAMLDAGKIREEDVQEGFHPAEIIEQSFNRWFSTLSKGMKYFDPILYLTDSSVIFTGCKDENNNNTASIGLSFKGMAGFILGDKLTQIEQTVPGLGETAIHILTRLLTSFSTSVMPDDILMSAQYLYWMGSEDESEQIEFEYEGNADDYEGLRRKDFDAAFPTWATSPNMKLNAAKLKKLSKSDNPHIAALASLLSQVDIAPLQGFVHSTEFDEEHYCIDPPVFARWSMSDLTVDIFDDWWNYVSECGGTELHGMWQSDITPDGISETYSQIEQMVDRMRLVENLLDMLADYVPERGILGH